MERINSSDMLSQWLEFLRCPQSGGLLVPQHHIDPQQLICTCCTCRFPIQAGIPKLIRPERRQEIDHFNQAYDRIRLHEGWASEAPGYYEALPFRDVTSRHPREWRLRAGSWQLLQHWLRKNFNESRCKIVDAGAGSGWLSRLLAIKHEVLALDVNGGRHGLNANPERSYLTVQAELVPLPLADRCVDLVIANASLHYVRDRRLFFAEAARVLQPGGKLVVMDSPVYRNKGAANAARQRTKDYYDLMQAPELIAHYDALVAAEFESNRWFRFRCLRPDWTYLDWLKKNVGSLLLQREGARFPFWVGESWP